MNTPPIHTFIIQKAPCNGEATSVFDAIKHLPVAGVDSHFLINTLSFSYIDFDLGIKDKDGNELINQRTVSLSPFIAGADAFWEFPTDDNVTDIRKIQYNHRLAFMLDDDIMDLADIKGVVVVTANVATTGEVDLVLGTVKLNISLEFDGPTDEAKNLFAKNLTCCMEGTCREIFRDTESK